MPRVVKLGGSLLDSPELPEAVRRWLAAQPPDGTLVVVGGGGAADLVRRADRQHGLDASTAHWLAVRTMGLGARRLAAVLPELPLVERLDALPKPDDAPACVLDPWHFLREVDARGPAPLPHDWGVTSDSIAARVAEHLVVDELVLLKSALPPPPRTRAAAAAAGYVDAFFPRAAARLPRVRCVNLRHAAMPAATLE